VGLALCICGTLGKGTLRTYPSFRVPTHVVVALHFSLERWMDGKLGSTGGGRRGIDRQVLRGRRRAWFHRDWEGSYPCTVSAPAAVYDLLGIRPNADDHRPLPCRG
jgi:hypothetical protein